MVKSPSSVLGSGFDQRLDQVRVSLPNRSSEARGDAFAFNAAMAAQSRFL